MYRWYKSWLYSLELCDIHFLKIQNTINKINTSTVFTFRTHNIQSISHNTVHKGCKVRIVLVRLYTWAEVVHNLQVSNTIYINTNGMSKSIEYNEWQHSQQCISVLSSAWGTLQHYQSVSDLSLSVYQSRSSGNVNDEVQWEDYVLVLLVLLEFNNKMSCRKKQSCSLLLWHLKLWYHLLDSSSKTRFFLVGVIFFVLYSHTEWCPVGKAT